VVVLLRDGVDQRVVLVAGRVDDLAALGHATRDVAVGQDQAVDAVELGAIDEAQAIATRVPLEVIQDVLDAALDLVVAEDLLGAAMEVLAVTAEVDEALVAERVLVEGQEHLVETVLEEEEVGGPDVFLRDEHGLARVLFEPGADDRAVPAGLRAL